MSTNSNQREANEPREVREVTLGEQTSFVCGDTVADVLRNTGSGASQGGDGIELTDGDRVLDPGQHLLVGHDPDVRHLLGPIEEFVDHVDLSRGRRHTGVPARQVNRTGTGDGRTKVFVSTEQPSMVLLVH